ncbi:hypothetical protein [Rheinheimera pacifica]|uniref:hypothetical protein n=1 Tax=Rheinheimera pacifica TaxID=173990 RepID=UPI002EDA7714
MMNNALLTTMTEAGIAPASPQTLAASGQIQRFKIETDKRGNLNSWIIHYCNGFDSDVYVFGSCI